MTCVDDKRSKIMAELMLGRNVGSRLSLVSCLRLEAGWRQAGGRLEAGWRQAGGRLEAGWRQAGGRLE